MSTTLAEKVSEKPVKSSQIGRAYQLASLAMADFIGSLELDLREWLVLDFVRRQTFGAGRCEAFIPRLSFFVAALRISKGNASAVLARMRNCLAIEERPQFCYGFRFPLAAWKLPARLDQVEVVRQLELLERPPHLRDALREGFVEQMGKLGGAPSLTGAARLAVPTEAGARGLIDCGDGSQPAPQQSGVPESGTVFPNRVRSAGCSRIGYEGQSPPVRGSYDPVPESGTALVSIVNKNCNNASIATTAVGGADAPSARKEPAALGRLDAEQQALMNELQGCGAFGLKNESRGCWLGMVRARRDVVAELLGDLRYARAQGLAIRSAGAWMMDRWVRWGRPD